MSQQAVMQYVAKWKGKVDQAIAEEVEKRRTEVAEISPHLVPVMQAVQELSVGGKRLRALLTILGYELAGAKAGFEVVRASMVMELFHLGLLCQDDVFDRDTLRRGVTTIHARYDDLHLGEGLAILAGDFTFGWGIEIMAKLDLPQEQVVRAIAVWGKYFTRVGYGEALDVMTEQRGAVSEEEMLMVARLKSGEYSCVLPLTLGATLGGAEQSLIKKLEQYAMELGWVFQLRDDWLAEYGNSKKTGKPVGNDSREGKKTYITVYGREKTESAIKEHLEKGRAFAGDNEILLGLLEWVATRES